MADTHVTLLGYDITIWGLGVAILAAIMPQGVNLYVEYSRSKREKNYIQVQIIFMLDKFAADCAAVARDDGYDPQWMKTGEAEAQVASPVFDLSALKGEYKFLKPALLYRLQSIEIKLLTINRRLETYIYDDPPEHPQYFALRRKQYAKLGMYVCDLSSDISKELKIKNDAWQGVRSPRADLQNSLKLLKSREEERQKMLTANAAKKVQNNSASNI